MKNIKKIIIFTLILFLAAASFFYRINYVENKNKKMIIDMDVNLKRFEKNYKPSCDNPEMVKQYNSMAMHYDIRVTRFNYLHPNNRIDITPFKKIKCN